MQLDPDSARAPAHRPDAPDDTVPPSAKGRTGRGRRRARRGRRRTALLATLLVVPTAFIVGGASIGDDCPPAAQGFPGCADSVDTSAAFDSVAPDVLEVSATDVEGVELVRVTGPDRSGDSAPRHQYSRRQAWNADETLLLVSDRILDAGTFEPTSTEPRLSSRVAWSATDPDLLIGIAYDPDPNVLATYNVRTDERVELHRFDGFESCSLGAGEGSPSDDGRRVVVSCREDEDDDEYAALVSWDLAAGVELGRIDPENDYNWATFTRSGNYILVENNDARGGPRSLVRYAPDFTDPVQLTTRVEHGDVGVDLDGRDVYVMIEDGGVAFIDIASGTRVPVPLRGGRNAFGFGHVSCRATGRPGWCYASTHGGGVVGAFAVGVDRSGLGRFPLVERLGLRTRGVSAFETWGVHASTASSYAAEPKASVSPSGRQIVFSSDWDGTITPSDFVLRLQGD